MFTYRNPMTVCCAAVLALGLAACGGSDNTADSTDSKTVEPTTQAPTTQGPTTQGPANGEPATASVVVPDFAYLSEENLPAAGTHEIEAGTTATNNGVTYLCATGGDDCTVTVAADGSATSTGGTVTAALTTDATTQVAEAKKKKTEEEAELAQMKRERAIGQSAAFAGGGSGTAPPFTVSRRAGNTASVRSTGYTAIGDPRTLGSFTGILLENASSAAATTHLMVFTDIDEPKKAEFYDYDGDSDTPAVYESATLQRPADDALPIAGGGAPAGRFTVSNLDSTIFPAKAATPADGNVTKTFAANYAATPGGSNDRVRLPGMFDGARGTYLCTPASGTSCVVTVTPAGAYSTDGAWTFTPNAGEKAYREDSEVLSFGWWKSTPAKSTGAYSFRAFHSGAAYADAASDGSAPGADEGALITGSATYTGNAAGRYVVGDDAGGFTANALLTAKFGNAREIGSIEGSITGFQGDGGADMSGWSVSLEEIEMTDITPTTGAAFSSSVTDRSSPNYDGTIATLGDTTAHGQWSGNFYGNAKNSDRPGENVNDAAPLAVGGTFHADGSNANIVGAFGARRPTE